jgi:hypothetical protein
MNRIRLWVAVLCLLASVLFGAFSTVRVVKADDPFKCNCGGDRGLRCSCDTLDVNPGGGCCCGYSCSVITEVNDQ